MVIDLKVYAELTIQNGGNVNINGTNFQCIKSVSNDKNGYQGYAQAK